MICVETRHMQAVLKAQINKTDRNDARGIAQMMRAELYRPMPWVKHGIEGAGDQVAHAAGRDTAIGHVDQIDVGSELE